MRLDLAAMYNLNLQMNQHVDLLEVFKAQQDGGDDLWDETCPYELSCKKAGLKRFFLEKKCLNKKSQKESNEESMESSTSKSSKTNALAGLADAPPVEVKVESKDYLRMRDNLKVIRSGEAKLGSCIKELKVLKAQLEFSSMSGGTSNAILLFNVVTTKQRTYIHVCFQAKPKCSSWTRASKFVKRCTPSALGSLP